MREIVEHTGAEAVEMVVAAMQRAKIGQGAQMPLADQRRTVTAFFRIDGSVG